jgi:ABC-type sulfate transport system permease component
MLDLCKYKNLLGVPGTGIHAFKIFGISIWDTLITIVVAIIIATIANWSYLYTIVGVFITGIFVHRLFCVRTAVDKLLFP